MKDLQNLFAQETQYFKDLFGSINEENNFSLKFKFLFDILTNVMEKNVKIIDDYRKKKNFGNLKFDIESEKKEIE